MSINLSTNDNSYSVGLLENESSSSRSNNKRRFKWSKSAALILFVLLLISGAAVAGYLIIHNEYNSSNNSSSSSSGSGNNPMNPSSFPPSTNLTPIYFVVIWIKSILIIPNISLLIIQLINQLS